MTALPPGVELAECKTCKRPIVWATTDTGRSMPIDPEPHAAGNIELRLQGGVVQATVVAGGPERTELAKQNRARRSHFVTCPQAGAHRIPPAKETTVTPAVAEKASTRKPTQRQHAVLSALLQLDHDSDQDDAQLHPTAAILECIHTHIDPHPDPAKVLEALQQIRKHGWIECVALGNAPLEGVAPGSHLQFIVTDGGKEAFDRGVAAVPAAQEETPVTTATIDPPAQEEAPPWGAGARPPKKGADPEPTTPKPKPPVEDDTEPGQEEPVRGGKENKIVGSQLTLKVGGPKPVASKLGIGAKSISFANEQWEQMQRIPVTAMLEIREVGTKIENNGKVTRIHKGILTEVEIDGQLVDDQGNDD